MAGDFEGVPAIDGWFTTGDEPALLGLTCTSCGTVVFPPQALTCPNPGCRSDDFDTTPLSRRGRLWSYTTNHYAPPAPYVAPDPFEPYTVAAVELDEERLVVLGQLAAGAQPEELRVGDEMELTVETLFTDEDGDHVVWKWRPAVSADAAST